MNFKAASRGLVWIAVGVALILAGFVLERPIVIKGTHVPFGVVVVAIGLIIVAFDLRKAARADKDPPAAK